MLRNCSSAPASPGGCRSALEGGNIDEFKPLLLDGEDQIARNLTQNLLVYATGAGLQFADRATVEKIVAHLESEGGGLRSIVHEIVQSDVFKNK